MPGHREEGIRPEQSSVSPFASLLQNEKWAQGGAQGGGETSVSTQCGLPSQDFLSLGYSDSSVSKHLLCTHEHLSLSPKEPM